MGCFVFVITTTKARKSLKFFVEENHLLYDLDNAPSTEYIQAATPCKLLVFSNSDWKEISDTIIVWESIIQKITNKALVEKLQRVSPLIAKDATTRYLEFLENIQYWPIEFLYLISRPFMFEKSDQIMLSILSIE